MDSPPTDAELLAASDDDAGAFRRLYDRHAGAIHAYFARRCEPSAAFEAVTETFAAAWLSRGRFVDRCDGDAGPWLSGIARHVWLRSLRSAHIERRARERLGLVAVDAVEPPPELREVPPGGAQAAAALGRLPAGQRDAVRLRVVDGLGYGEVAEQLECTEVAARLRVSRGLGRIRRELGDEATGGR